MMPQQSQMLANTCTYHMTFRLLLLTARFPSFRTEYTTGLDETTLKLRFVIRTQIVFQANSWLHSIQSHRQSADLDIFKFVCWAEAEPIRLANMPPRKAAPKQSTIKAAPGNTKSESDSIEKGPGQHARNADVSKKRTSSRKRNVPTDTEELISERNIKSRKVKPWPARESGGGTFYLIDIIFTGQLRNSQGLSVSGER